MYGLELSAKERLDNNKADIYVAIIMIIIMGFFVGLLIYEGHAQDNMGLLYILSICLLYCVWVLIHNLLRRKKLMIEYVKERLNQ